MHDMQHAAAAGTLCSLLWLPMPKGSAAATWLHVHGKGIILHDTAVNNSSTFFVIETIQTVHSSAQTEAMGVLQFTQHVDAAVMSCTACCGCRCQNTVLLLLRLLPPQIYYLFCSR
jgi:hypothetical protein